MSTIWHNQREVLNLERALELRRALIPWFDANQRDLPWRKTEDAYAIWVSEIMLQQTQVVTVIDYWNRWLERFPDVFSLAEAEQEEVLEIWAGLGYYRRARMLHQAAKVVAESGVLPNKAAEWLELPGVGRYTAGAIASTAYGEAAPIVDGNVIRVYSRLFALEGDPRSGANQRTLWALAEALVDVEAPGAYNQSVMELGATVCTPKKPACLLCPVREHCAAFGQGSPLAFPEPTKRVRQRLATSHTAIVRQREDERRFLVIQRPEDGLLGGLWEFPTLGHDAEPGSTLDSWLIPWLDGAERIEELGSIRHVFSHLKMTYEVSAWTADGVSGEFPRAARWLTREEMKDLPLSVAMRKVERLADDGES